MTYTFVSATYANPEHTAAVAFTEDSAAVALSAADTPDEWAVLLAWGEPDAFVAAPVIASALTARQLRLGLVMNGFSLDQVATAIEAIEDAHVRAMAKVEWEYASQFERDHPLIAQVGAALGLATEQVDVMWPEAAGL
jgi:hypothetical protein